MCLCNSSFFLVHQQAYIFIHSLTGRPPSGRACVRECAGPPSPNIRRDRVGESLHLEREKGGPPLLRSAAGGDEGVVQPVVTDVVRVEDELLLLVQLPAGYRLPPKDKLLCYFGSGTFADAAGAEVYRFRRAAVRCPYPPAGFAWQASHVTVEVGGNDAMFRRAYYRKQPLAWNRLVYDMWATDDDVVLFAKRLSRTRDFLQDVRPVVCVYNGTLEVPVTVAAQEVARCPHPSGADRESLLTTSLTLKVNGSLFPSVVYYEHRNRPETQQQQQELLSRGSGDSQQQQEDDDLVRTTTNSTSTRRRFFEGSSRVDSWGTSGRGGSSSELDPHTDAGAGEDASTSGHGVGGDKKHFLCACNLIWNGAKFLREWVTYHAFMGVDKFFFYDNNSDDELQDTIRELVSSNFQITRVPWPWRKAQEAGFAHCALLAGPECTWMMYADVDEYAFPKQWLNLLSPAATDSHVIEGSSAHGGSLMRRSRSLPPVKRDSSTASVRPPLHSLIVDKAQTTASGGDKDVGQISLRCRDFGPSGLTHHPVQGLTVGYTCRVVATERHKSIVLLAAIDKSLRNAIHHFDLSPEYRIVYPLMTQAVINHYKYQAWEEFQTKFRRRVSAYVVDWKKPANLHNKDRAPGLGSEAVKPDDWEQQFCEVHDYELRDYVLRVFSVGHEPERVMIWE